MNLGFADIWVIAVIVALAVIGFVVFRLRKKKESSSSGKQFLVLGIIWLLMGLGYSLWRGENPFDIAFFNLGLIFTVAGTFQLIIEKFNKKRQ